MAICCLINSIEWLLALAFCGWEPMQSMMILAAGAYSCYLTLNDYIFVTYIFMVALSTTQLGYEIAELN